MTSNQSEWPPLQSLQIITAGESVEEKKASYAVIGSTKLVQAVGRKVWSCLKKPKTELPCDPAVPLLDRQTKV